MEILSLSDIVDCAHKESMDTIYIEFEKDGLYTYQTYGTKDGIGYCLGDKGWNPIYTSTEHDLFNKVEKNSPFYNGSVLVQIK